MDELIKRQDALDALCDACTLASVKSECIFKNLESCMDHNAILDVPAVEEQWIPCSERLPEETKDILVCYDFKGNRSVLIGALYSDEKFYGYDDEYLTPEGRKYRKAVAWMPLPEPYKGEQE